MFFLGGQLQFLGPGFSLGHDAFGLVFGTLSALSLTFLFRLYAGRAAALIGEIAGDASGEQANQDDEYDP